MKPSEIFEFHRQAIRDIVLSNRARNPRVFGSVAHGADTVNSDIDILVDPDPDMDLLDLAHISHEIKNILNVKVDVVTPNSLPDSFRLNVIQEAKRI